MPHVKTNQVDKKFVRNVETKLGFRLNYFAFRGEPIGTVFFRKCGRKWEMLTFDEAREMLK